MFNTGVSVRFTKYVASEIVSPQNWGTIPAHLIITGFFQLCSICPLCKLIELWGVQGGIAAISSYCFPQYLKFGCIVGTHPVHLLHGAKV